MSWYWLIKEQLENKELEVIKEEESVLYKGQLAYLLKGYDKYIPAKACEIITR